MDFEGLDIHPTTRLLYATAYDNSKIAILHIIDAVTGMIAPVGPITGFEEVVGLSFRPSDGVLYGWSEDNGLITINTATGAGTLVYSNSKNVEGLAWNDDGTLLYAVEDDNLYVYDPSDPGLTRIDRNLPGSTDAEGLEMRPDGKLWIGIHGRDRIYVYDIEQEEIVSGESITTTSTYNDIEGIASCWLP